ncbi:MULTISPECIES: hypothetical protein [Flavobacterium]|uniref:hypothetical protein n=1 Tax=Flavobacterium TaxID=237 RepID=UPI001183CD7A|nr:MULTISPECIES: hypothetical protein [Flavobacterium]MCR4030397.1 hypothetical protein [Flavobacterium panacis]
MEIQKYIEQIRGLENSQLDQNTELENVISKMIFDGKSIYFQVNDLFQNQNQNQALLSKIEQTLNLIFIKEENANVCFANSDEVRSEYKQSFRLIDLLDYVYVFAHSAFYKQSHKIIIPADAEVFWKLVEIKKY